MVKKYGEKFELETERTKLLEEKSQLVEAKITLEELRARRRRLNSFVAAIDANNKQTNKPRWTRPVAKEGERLNPYADWTFNPQRGPMHPNTRAFRGRMEDRLSIIGTDISKREGTIKAESDRLAEIDDRCKNIELRLKTLRGE